ncbi:hypothetical protein [Rhizobium sp. FKY42]|uniref:hypothetical protein n=1 Tax=Rhizobium sp. FKY42 TaxID=2562310 RepID=UPI0010BF7DA5|nr:hypothetical protein [Rhizobium sp. FKY42]
MAANIFEIFHSAETEAGPYQTFVRFSLLGAGGFPPLPSATPPATDNIFEPVAFKRIVSDLKDKSEVAFWACKGKGTKPGRTLFVFDALFLDQFSKASAALPTERFPLVPSYVYNGVSRTSCITFGNSDEPGYRSYEFRFELAFPTPVAIGRDAAAPGETGGAISLGALFDFTVNGTDFTKPQLLLTGPSGGTGVVRKQYKFGDYAVATTVDADRHVIDVPAETDVPHMQSLLAAMGFPGQKGTVVNHVVEYQSHAVSNEEYIYLLAVRGDLNLIEQDGVVLESGAARLDLSLQYGGVLDIDGGKVTAECHWHVRLTDQTVKELLASPAKMANTDFRAALRFVSTAMLKDGNLGSSDVKTPFDKRDRMILRGGGLEEAARLSRLARGGMPTTLRQPQSTMPDFISASGGDRLAMPLLAIARQLYCALNQTAQGASITRRHADKQAVSQFDITLNTDQLDDKPQPPLLSRPAKDVGWRIPPSSGKPVPLRMVQPAFNEKVGDTANPAHDHNHVRIAFDGALLAGDAGRDDDESSISVAIGNDPASATLHVGSKKHFAGLETRLGSLAFARDGLLLTGTDNRLRIVRRHRPMVDARHASDRAPKIGLEWDFSFAIDIAEPVTVDVAHGDRTSRPADLLIRETLTVASPEPERSTFILRMRETLQDDNDWQLTASLSERKQAAGDVPFATFTVLSDAPFSAYRFSRQPLSQGGEDRPVAQYDSDTRDWNMFLQDADYMFVRPASSTGEAADKPGMLEIHDPINRTVPIRPAPPQTDVTRKHAVDMRYSPPTVLWVDPSDLARAYMLPEYRARDLFTGSSDFGIGRKLTALRTELLYGLSTGLVVPPAEDGRSGPRVAELEALTGRMVKADEKKDATATRWRELRKAFQRRPERLEVWSLDTRRSDPFVPSQFDSGLTFALRSTALLAPPVKAGEYEAKSTASGLAPPRFHERGLAGGAMWPLESANVTRVFAENPSSSDGTLGSIALTPMGDSGNQTVRFLNGYITVITETREGRLHKHRVEVLGRIAGLWHRAKHVVIYERTTAASAQFAPYPHQPTRTRRPVLRKVEEFIEILQPSRRYPDIEDVAPRSRGFLEEVRFNSCVIHVNSAWGRDVGTEGWEVPLWNRGEAELRPQVYPFPDVAFVTAGEGGGERPQAVQECLDVAHLYFYTDAKAAETTANTDRWPIRDGIDTSPFGHMDFLRDVAASADALVGNKSDAERMRDGEQQLARKAASIRILPGLRRFTWRLAPSAIRTRLNAERGDKPIFAGLESVSLMRAPGSVPAKDSIKTELGHRLRAGEPQALLKPDLVLPYGTGNQPTAIPTYGKVVALLKTIGDNEPTPAQLTDLKAALGAMADVAGVKEIDTFLSRGESVLNKVKEFADGAPTLIAEAWSMESADCDQIATKAAGTIQKRKLLLLEMIRQAETEAIAALEPLALPTREDVRDLAEREIVEATSDILTQASQGVVSIRSEIATARAIVGDWRSDAESAMMRARARLKALRNAYDDEKPWSINRFDKAIKQVHDEFDAVAMEGQAALAEARQRFAVEIGGAASALGGRISACIAQVINLKKSTDAAAADYAQLVDMLFRPVIDAADGLQPAINGTIANLQTAIDSISDPQAKAAASAVLSQLQLTLGAVNLGKKIKDLKDGVGALKLITADFNSATKTIFDSAKAVAVAALDSSEAATKAAVDFTQEELQTLSLALVVELDKLEGLLTASAQAIFDQWREGMLPLDIAVERAVNWIDVELSSIGQATNTALGAIDSWLASFDDRVKNAQATIEQSLVEQFMAQVVNPILDTVFAADWPTEADSIKAHTRAVILQISQKAEAAIDSFTALPLAAVSDAKKLCEEAIAARNSIRDGLESAAQQAAAELKPILDAFSGGILDPSKWKDTRAGVDRLLGATAEIANRFAEAGENVRSYIDRGADVLSQIGSAKASALPGLALQLFSAATQAPEIATFRTNAERIRILLDEAKDALETTPVRGMLNQLGDGLKSVGLDFNFKEFGDTFRLDVDKDTLLRRLIPDFGINFSGMLPRAKIPGGIANAVKITHDIDPKAGRAWARADVNAPMPDREELFSHGIFTFFLKSSLLKAFLRAEASKDQKEITITDQALLTTTIEMVVGGEVMAALEDVLISYSSKGHLDFTLDPRKIRIHRAMQMIQDTLGSIFPDAWGGLKFLKEGGVPVGVEHDFTMPPMSLNFGTSGVSNIQIANHFSLRAYPDFVIADRFNLSRRELPFIFSFFIIGGTGYIQIEAEYRPFGPRLMVSVEAAVGGSAALAFSFGPVSGGVYITLSVAIRFQKMIGGPAGSDQGLSVSLVLVVAGNVSLWGMVSVYLTLMLSISYQDSGKAEAFGSLSVEVRISRWFKLRYSTQVTYNLRDGRSSSQSQTEVTIPEKYQQMLDKFEALDQARKAL